MDWLAFWAVMAVGMFFLWLCTMMLLRDSERLSRGYREAWEEETAMRRSLMYGTPWPHSVSSSSTESEKCANQS